MLKLETECSNIQSRDWDLRAYTQGRWREAASQDQQEVKHGSFDQAQSRKNFLLHETAHRLSGAVAAAMLHEPWSWLPQRMVLGAVKAGASFAHGCVCIEKKTWAGQRGGARTRSMIAIDSDLETVAFDWMTP